MDLLDLWWNSAQDQKLEELKAQTHAQSLNGAASIRRLQEENRELRIRIGVLIRMLIERGVFSADDFTAMVRSTKEQLGEAKPHTPAQGKKRRTSPDATK